MFIIYLRATHDLNRGLRNLKNRLFTLSSTLQTLSTLYFFINLSIKINMKLKNKIKHFVKCSIVLGVCISSIHLIGKTTNNAIAKTNGKIYIENAYICTEIQKLEPVNSNTCFNSSVQYLYCWNKIINASGSTIQHIWYYKGRRIASIPLTIRYNSFRTYSKKSIPADWIGDWKVEIINENGILLEILDFYITEGECSSYTSPDSLSHTFPDSLYEIPPFINLNDTLNIPDPIPAELDTNLNYDNTNHTLYLESAVLCTDVIKHEPIGINTIFSDDILHLYCWCKIHNGKGHYIKHIWYYNNKKIMEIILDINYDFYCTYSRKTIPHNWNGQWKVEIIDGERNLLKSLEATIK